MPVGALLPVLSQVGFGLGQESLDQFHNAQSRKWSEKMYQRQYDDNVRFWNTQNEYNSPEMQMNRLKAAGLNPNLVYGNGSAVNIAGPVKSPEVQKPTFDFTPNTALSNAGNSTMQLALDMETKELTNDNLRTQNEVMQQRMLLDKASTAATLTGEAYRRFRLEYEQGLAGVSADTAREKLRQLRTGTDISLEKNAREAVALSNSITESIQRMSESRQRVAQSKDEQQRIRASTDLLLKDAEVRQLEIDLRKEGFSPSDPAWQRVVIKLLTNYAEGKMEKPKGLSLLQWLMK